jgi:glycosyltransferase involved in cell wall biosynthesis
MQRTTRFLAASDELAELIERVGAPRDRVHVWRLGVELPSLDDDQQPADEVLMVGRFVEKKGFEYGLRAFAAVSAGFSNLRLAIVGDGPLGSRLRELARSLGIDERVEFAGVLPHAEVLERVSRCRILLAPSVTAASGDRESGLIVVKEAAARGVPAVASRHGGIPEIIVDGATGFLVEERDVDTLADRLRRLLGSSALRDRFGLAARRRMEAEYEIGARVRELERHYDEARTEHERR